MIACPERPQTLTSGNNGNKPPVRVLVALADVNNGDEFNERGRGSDGPPNGNNGALLGNDCAGSALG